MKLFRLTTRKATAEFDAIFNDQVIIPANSQIALQSASLSLLPQSIVVDGVNNGITYVIAPNVTRTVLLTGNKTYFVTNLQDLYNDMTLKLNLSTFLLPADGSKKMLGLEWKVEQNLNKKTQIGYKIGRHGNYHDNWTLSATAQVSGGSNDYKYGQESSQTPSSDASSNFIFSSFISRGNGYIRAQIGTLVYDGALTEANQGFYVALTENMDVTTTTLALADIKYGVQVTFNAGGNMIYNIIEDGVATLSSVTPGYVSATNTNNDHIEVGVDGNSVIFNAYQGGSSTATPLRSGVAISYLNMARLKPVGIFNGIRTKASARRVRLTPSPYTEKELIDSDIQGLGTPPSSSPSGTAVNTLAFESEELALFLGYKSQNVPAPGEDPLLGATMNFIANFQNHIAQEADAILVELQNLQVESYDSFSNSATPSGGQRRNLLSVVPATNETNSVVYEPPYPTFLDLNNKDPIYLRNLRVRCVRTDYTEIAIIGLATLVILIKEK